jgi:hypothetical protein
VDVPRLTIRAELDELRAAVAAPAEGAYQGRLFDDRRPELYGGLAAGADVASR